MKENEEFAKEEAKKDETKTIFFSYSGSCYGCCFWLFYFAILALALPMIITLDWIVIVTFFPIIIFIIIIMIYLKSNHYKKLEVAYNYYYNRVKIIVKNDLGQEKKILDIPKESACFTITTTSDRCFNSPNSYILHIWDKFDKNTSIDIRKVYMEKVPPKFYWYFEYIYTYDIFKLEKELNYYIGKNMLVDYHVKFVSKNPDKILKYFYHDNFVSFSFNSRIKFYIILLMIFICVLIYVIELSIKNSNNNTEQRENKTDYTNITNNGNENNEEGSLAMGFIIGLTWPTTLIIILILVYFFKYNRKRIDFFLDGNKIFIGITSFLQTSYKKLFLFDCNSIERCILSRNDCKQATLSLKLKDGKIQKICDFTGEDQEDLVSLENRLKELIR